MAQLSVECICDRRFATAELVRRFPPRLVDRNKSLVFSLAAPPGAVHAGEIIFSRWRTTGFPTAPIDVGQRTEFELREVFFTYDPPPPGRVEWHLNFAHSDLFSFYGGSLFAQDEMQVTEHPALASLRHALLDAGIDPMTVDRQGPTPCLMMGVERRCAVATNPDPAQGRPRGLYGNAFAVASEDAVRRATRILQPPTISNILAIEAPSYGRGCYSEEQVAGILDTAYTGFAAAREAARLYGPADAKVVIHTGYWGCGAYGGNRIVMVLCQLVAAHCAGIDALVFHAGPDGESFRDALRIFEDLCPAGAPVDLPRLIAAVESRQFRWGVSDGN